MSTASRTGGAGRGGRGLSRVRSGTSKATEHGHRAKHGHHTAREARLEARVEELRSAVEQSGVRVRRERLMREVGYHVRSGLVRLGDEEILLLDLDLALDAQEELLLDVLGRRGASAPTAKVDKARRRS
jgi:hypothetical protein